VRGLRRFGQLRGRSPTTTALLLVPRAIRTGSPLTRPWATDLA